jgi:signal transduction histidine kinase/GAF domain-containing protein
VSEFVPEIPEELLVRSARDAEHLAIARQLGLKSYMAVPIRTSSRVLGALSLVMAETRRSFTQDDLRLAEQLCDTAAIALTNAQLYRGVQRAAAEAEVTGARIAKLQEVTVSLASTKHPRDVADVAMDLAFRHLQATASVLYTLVGDSFQLLAHRGVPSPIEQWQVLSLDAGVPVATAMRTGTPQWIESHAALLDAYPSLVSFEMSAQRLQSVIALPLLVHGVVVGGLAFSFAEARTVGVLERSMLVAMAGQIGQSLERTRLDEAEQLAQQRRRENEARYRYIFDAAAVGIAEKDYTEVKCQLDAVVAAGETDLRGYLTSHPEFVEAAIDQVRIRNVNEAMMRLFHATEKSQLFALRAIFLPESRPLFIEELVGLMEGTRIVSGETTLRTLRGDSITVLATVAFPASGFDRVLISRTDITEHKHILKEREQLVDKLKTTVRLNEMFAATLGHDLRTPLSAMLTAAQLIYARSQDEDLRRPTRRILSSGERMTRMIEQLLDFTRARMGDGIAIQRRDMDLGPLCKQILGELEDGSLDCVIQLEILGNTHGRWDPDRVAQVISNIAGNACQHRLPKASVRVQLDGSAQHEVVLSVTNRGQIPAHVLPILFNPFRGTQQRTHGLGLGLFISQQIVVGHGGEIAVSSAEGETVFTVRLPRGISDK